MATDTRRMVGDGGGGGGDDGDGADVSVAVCVLILGAMLPPCSAPKSDFFSIDCSTEF